MIVMIVGLWLVGCFWSSFGLASHLCGVGVLVGLLFEIWIVDASIPMRARPLWLGVCWMCIAKFLL